MPASVFMCVWAGLGRLKDLDKKGPELSDAKMVADKLFKAGPPGMCGCKATTSLTRTERCYQISPASQLLEFVTPPGISSS